MLSPHCGGSTVLIIYAILSLLAITAAPVDVLFNPGERNVFDFIDIVPGITDDESYRELCPEGYSTDHTSCHLSVIFNYTLVVSNSSRFEVLTVNQAGPYILKVNTGDYGLALTHVVNVKPTYLCLYSLEDYLTRQIGTVFKRDRTAVVICPIMGEPRPDITWKKKNKYDEFESILPTDRHVITLLGHLFILNYTDSDAAVYYCTAKNSCGRRCAEQPFCSGFSVESEHMDLTIIDDDDGHGYTKSQFYYLNPKPSISCWYPEDCWRYSDYYPRMMMFVPFNGTINIEVYVDYTARYVGATMDSITMSPRFKSYSKHVCFAKLINFNYKDQDNGAFTCSTYDAQNYYGDKGMFNFAIIEPPKISPVGPAHDHKADPVTFGSDHRIDFKVEIRHRTSLNLSVAVEDYMCFKDSDDVGMKDGWHTQCSYNMYTQTIRVSISCATPSDTGYYQVSLWSPYGSVVSKEIFLKVADEAAGSEVDCYSLEYQVVSGTEISLSWTKPKTNEDILHYLIIVDNLGWSEKTTLVTTMTTKIVGGLHPGTDYVAEVFSRGQLVGRRVRMRTLDAVPTAAPTTLQCVAHSASVKCEWGTVPRKHQNGIITGYELRHRTDHHGTHWNKEKPVNATTVIISDLRPVTNYTLEIAGCTSAGCGPYHRTTTVTSEDYPAFAPMYRYITASSRSIKMGWDRAHGTFKHLYYKVTCTHIENTEMVFEQNITQLEILIKDFQGEDVLRPSTFYKVTVTPGSSRGMGPPLERTIQTRSDSPRGSTSLILYLSWLLFLIS